MKYIHSVRYYETDRMGFAHHSNYLRWMEEARIEMMEKLGYGYQKMEDEGIISPVTKASLEYLKTTTFPDDVTIDVKVKSVGAVRLVISYEMTLDDGSLVCRAESEHCFLEKSGKIARIRKRLPDFYEKLKSLEETGD